MAFQLRQLPPNQIHRFYRGGERIARFRGVPLTDDHAPEDWVGSTTSVFGDSAGVGLSRLAGGDLLADLIAADAASFLGAAHARAYGSDCRLLVKLLDAGARLPVHAHPDAHFARKHLNLTCGKTEAWVILEAESGACVHVGFSRDIGQAQLLQWSESQDVEEMLSAMNEIPVHAGDAIFVPAGTLHAIGSGILLVELQEASDLSILLEWDGVVDQKDAYLGLTRELALSSFDTNKLGPTRLAELTASRGSQLFPQEADAFFRGSWVEGGDELDPGFSVIVVCDGEGEVAASDGEKLRLKSGMTALIPANVGTCTVTGTVRILRCQPLLVGDATAHAECALLANG